MGKSCYKQRILAFISRNIREKSSQTIVMKSCLAFFVLVCVAVAVSGLDKCFKKDELDKHMKEMKVKKFAPIIEKCQAEKKDSTEADLKACGIKKFTEAMEACKKENPNDDNTKNMYCASKKLGIKCSEDEKDFGKFKNMILGLTLDDKKKVIEDACTPCEKKEHFHMCVTENLKEKCEEVKNLWEKMKEHLE